MSVGSYNNEDIRNLIYQAPPPDEKFPMYHSKFSKKVREDTKKVKSCHKTFGYAEVPLDPPSNFLKKKTRIVRRPFVGEGSFGQVTPKVITDHFVVFDVTKVQKVGLLTLNVYNV